MEESLDYVEGLAKASGLFYNGTEGTMKCFDIFTEFVECADQTGCGVGPASMAWDYQVNVGLCQVIGERRGEGRSGEGRGRVLHAFCIALIHMNLMMHLKSKRLLILL